MKYYAVISNVKTGELVTLQVFTELQPGAVIGWGADENGDMAHWQVIQFYKL